MKFTFWEKLKHDILYFSLGFTFSIPNFQGLRESSQNGEKIDRALKRIVSLQSQLKQLKPESIISDSQKSLVSHKFFLSYI